MLHDSINLSKQMVTPIANPFQKLLASLSLFFFTYYIFISSTCFIVSRKVSKAPASHLLSLRYVTAYLSSDNVISSQHTYSMMSLHQNMMSQSWHVATLRNTTEVQY